MNNNKPPTPSTTSSRQKQQQHIIINNNSNGLSISPLTPAAATTNLHSAITSLIEKEVAQSEAISAFFTALEARRRAESTQLLEAEAMRRRRRERKGGLDRRDSNRSSSGVSEAKEEKDANAPSFDNENENKNTPQQQSRGGRRSLPRSSVAGTHAETESSQPPDPDLNVSGNSLGASPIGISPNNGQRNSVINFTDNDGGCPLSSSSCGETALQLMAVTRAKLSRDHTMLLFSQHDAHQEGALKRALNEALQQLAAFEDTVLPSVEKAIVDRRRAAVQSANKTMQTLHAKLREAEEEEGCIDAAVWEAEIILKLLTAQSKTMRAVIDSRQTITETGLEEMLARDAAAEGLREQQAAEEAHAVLRGRKSCQVIAK